MLPKKERLNRARFSRFFASGKRYHGNSLTLIVAPDTSFCASAVAPKKVFKTAVERNQFRRRIYAMFERWQKHEPLSGAFICIAKAGAHERSSIELEHELLDLIHKSARLR